eukprot:7059989-Pyramimonas_sp.AAC.1
MHACFAAIIARFAGAFVEQLLISLEYSWSSSSSGERTTHHRYSGLGFRTMRHQVAEPMGHPSAPEP